MDESDRENLRRNRLALCRDLESKQATSFLYSKGILSEKHKQDIEAKDTPGDRNELLLDILPRCGRTAYKAFLDFLAKYQVHLLKLLQPQAEERSGPTDNTDASAMPPSDDRPPNETEPYNSQTNPRSASSTLPIQDGNSQAHTTLNAQIIPTDTEDGGISPTSNTGSDGGSDQGDGKNNSYFTSPSSQKNGVDPREIYPMRSNLYRGKAFIINNKLFEPSSGMEKYPRNGTDVDAEKLDELFKNLGFETEVYHNQTTEQTLEIADSYSTANYSTYDCFMCAVLTHGEEGLIYSIDGKLPIKDFTSKFKTKGLFGKPKLFFFQACQGLDYMEGTDQHDGPADEVDAPGNNKITLPVEADFLYAYSTVPGYYSWRNSVRGSWFGQAIVSVFREHARSMDVMRMLTRVNEKVAKQISNTGQYSSTNKKQIPSIISQLRKELYFFPENVVDGHDDKNGTIENRKKSCFVCWCCPDYHTD